MFTGIAGFLSSMDVQNGLWSYTPAWGNFWGYFFISYAEIPPAMALTHVQCKQAPATDKPYKLAGGGGLYLLVNPNGQKYWRYKYRFGGKEKTLALGVFPEVSLSSVTATHKAAREVLASGRNPARVKKDKEQAAKISQASTFAAIAAERIDSRKSGWSDVHAERVESLFKTHINPEIGDKPIAELRSMDVLETIRKMERKGLGESCYKALAHISKVCTYAVVSGRATVNVAADLSEHLKANSADTKAGRPISYDELVRRTSLSLLELDRGTITLAVRRDQEEA